MSALFLSNVKDDRQALIDSKGKRVGKTCEWFMREPAYIAWQNSMSPPLWISGGPGKGKTMLAIYLTQEIERMAKEKDAVYLYFFCISTDDRRNTAIAVLRSYLYQLLEQKPHLVKYAAGDFKSAKEGQSAVSTIQTLWRIFSSMLQDATLPPVYCLLDGIDECDNSIESLLKMLHDLFPEAENGHTMRSFNLLVVSRHLPNIECWLSSFQRIRLDPDSDPQVGRDVNEYISQKVYELSKNNRLPKRTLEDVELSLKTGAKGTFLWVGFVANQLNEKNNVQVRRLLRDLPHELSGIYDRMMAQIEKLELDYQNTVKSILRLITVAQRPLTLKELAAASHIDEDDITSYLEFCGQFLQTIRNNTVNLVHQSAKDYLQRHEPYQTYAHLVVAKVCLKYLEAQLCDRAVMTWNEDHDTILQDCPFLDYAIIYWPEHAKYASDATKNDFNFSGIFFENSKLQDNWLRSYETYFECFAYDSGPISLMHIAAHFNIITLAHWILYQQKILMDPSLSKPGEESAASRIQPLWWAAQRGHEEIVSLLLRSGVDVNYINLDGMALHVASREGHEEVVKLLLQSGADVNAQDKYCGTALHKASEGGHEGVVKLLLQSGADVNAQDEHDGSALYRALEGGHEGVVKLLLQSGADFNSRDEYYETSLLKTLK